VEKMRKNANMEIGIETDRGTRGEPAMCPPLISTVRKAFTIYVH
jgi:hypothetical protein